VAAACLNFCCQQVLDDSFAVLNFSINQIMCRPVDVWFDFIKAWIRKDLCNSRTESDSAVQHCTLYTAGHSCNWKVCMPALATAFDPKQTKDAWLSKIRPTGKMKSFKL
jgi:hypothetical protein